MQTAHRTHLSVSRYVFGRVSSPLEVLSLEVRPEAATPHVVALVGASQNSRRLEVVQALTNDGALGLNWFSLCRDPDSTGFQFSVGG